MLITLAGGKGAAVSVRIFRSNLLGRATGGQCHLLGGGKSSRVRGGLGPAPRLYHAQEVHRHQDQRTSEEQHRRRNHGDRTGFRSSAEAAHPVS